MTTAQAETLYMHCQWTRKSHRLTIRKWETVSDHERERRAMMRIWVEAMEAVAVEVMTAPQVEPDYGYMTENDYCERIAAGYTLKATVLA